MQAGKTIAIGTVVLMSLVLVAAGCSRSDETLAKVGGRKVTQQEFDAYVQFKRLNAADEKRRETILNQYLEREALASTIEKEGVLDQALIDAELNEFRKEMLISRYFEQFLNDKVSDEAVLNYYNLHADRYEQQQVRVAHVLFRTQRSMSEEERRAKLTAAQEVYSKLRAGGDFAKLAEEYSEDRISGKKGGDLGWLKQGAVDTRFSETVFNMEAGEVSEPFETAFGFHVVKLMEGPLVAKQPFDAVKGDIRYQLRNEARDAELKRLLAAMEIRR